MNEWEMEGESKKVILNNKIMCDSPTVIHLYVC